MLPKENRLTKREDFSRVYKKGFYSQTESIAVKFLRTEKTATRIGFSVGKNYSKLATKRNLARRILRGSARKHLLALREGLDIIIILQPNKKSSGVFTSILAENALYQIFSKNNLFK